MTPLVVLILAVMWVLVLVPPLLRSRSDGRPSASVSSFNRQLSTLGRAAPGRAYGSYRTAPVRTGYGRATAAPSYAARRSPSSSYRPAPMSQRYAAKRRRQQVLLTLVGLAFFTGVVVFGLGMRSLLWVHLAVDAALLGYVYLLVKLRQAEQARAWARQSAWYEAA